MATNSATETMQQQHIQCKHTTHNLDHQAHARGCMFVLSQMRVAATGQRAHMTGLHVAYRNARSCQQHACFCREFPISREIPVVWEFPGNGNSQETGNSCNSGIPEAQTFPAHFPGNGNFPGISHPWFPIKHPCGGSAWAGLLALWEVLAG